MKNKNLSNRLLGIFSSGKIQTKTGVNNLRFNFFNIPVTIFPNFWLFLIFFANLLHSPSLEGLIVAAIMVISLLIHEWGHAATAAFFGARPEITLEAFGGRAHYDPRGMSSKQQFFITLNGPLLQSLLVVLPYYLLKTGLIPDHSLWGFVLHVTMRLNLYWVLLNLIPIMPLDGGFLLLHFLEKPLREKALSVTAILGVVAGAITIPLLVSNQFYFFAVLVGIFAYQNLQILQAHPLKSSPYSDLNRATSLINEKQVAKGVALLKKLTKSSEVQVKHTAIESLAKIYMQQEAHDQSYAVLLDADPAHLKEGKLLLAKLAYEQKNYSLVTLYAEELYEREPTYATALLIAKSFGWIDQPAHAGAWLKTALQFSEPSDSLETLLDEEAFNNVKHQELFATNLGQVPQEV